MSGLPYRWWKSPVLAEAILVGVMVLLVGGLLGAWFLGWSI